MKNINLLLMTMVISLIIVSCSAPSGRKSGTTPPDMHTAEISLDWQGTYSGVLPCADCQGIETELKLNDDFTYRLISNYQGKESLSDTLTGTFTLKGNYLTLDNIVPGEMSGKYKVEENRIRHLDMDGNEVTGELAGYYILTKEGNPLVEDQRWQLIEIIGQPVEGDPETHYLIFHSADGRAETKAGCNVLLYPYKIKHELQVRFERGVTTLMMCPDNLEDQYREILETVDNLSCDGETLTLNKARMAPLARFKRVDTE